MYFRYIYAFSRRSQNRPTASDSLGLPVLFYFIRDIQRYILLSRNRFRYKLCLLSLVFFLILKAL